MCSELYKIQERTKLGRVTQYKMCNLKRYNFDVFRQFLEDHPQEVYINIFIEIHINVLYE